jgi:cell division septation protein DedD
MKLIQGLVAAAVTLIMAATMVVISPTQSAEADVTCDSLCTRVRSELKVFTDWLAANNAKGYIGEAGWPGTVDTALWNGVADAWYRDADAAGLWVTAWATGEWWPNSYALNTYYNSVSEGSPIDTTRPSAAVVENHSTTASYMRGVNVNGGEFGAPSWSVNTSTFSNNNRGTYNSNYHYDGQGTFNYLASRGVKVVRLPFRWERIQPTLSGALDAAELQRLNDAINRAKAAGLQVIPTAFNYGGYMLHDGTQGVRRTIGSAYLTNSHFSDLWRRLSASWASNTAVVGYGLMNEPSSMTPASGLTAAKTWEKASQSALNAIRNRGDRKLVLVPGYNWSGAQRWSSTHPTSWIVDSANNFRYEAHHYWDRDNSGQYKNSYSAEVADASSRGYGTTTVTAPPTTAPSTTTTAAPTTTTAAPTTTTAAPTTTTTAAPTTTTTAPVSTTPSLRVNDIYVQDGAYATFTISLSAPSTKTVSVNYATAPGTATEWHDYHSVSGTASFSPGQTSRTVSVYTVNDYWVAGEPSETFFLNLSSPVNATIADGSGTATLSA